MIKVRENYKLYQLREIELIITMECEREAARKYIQKERKETQEEEIYFYMRKEHRQEVRVREIVAIWKQTATISQNQKKDQRLAIAHSCQ